MVQCSHRVETTLCSFSERISVTHVDFNVTLFWCNDFYNVTSDTQLLQTWDLYFPQPCCAQRRSNHTKGQFLPDGFASLHCIRCIRYISIRIYDRWCGQLWLTGRASVLLSEGCWFDSLGLHVEVSLGKILNPKLLLMCWSALCMAAITVWTYELL